MNWPTLLTDDMHNVLLRTPRDVCELLKKVPGLTLGGGFIRSVIAGEHINDIDLFGPSKEVLERAAQSFALSRGARFHATDNAFTVLSPGRNPVQFIHRWTYATPEALVADFDFTIAQAAIWWRADVGVWASIAAPTYYADLAARRLRYMAPSRAEDAGGSMMRARKFLSRGYRIEANSLAKVVARMAMGVDEIRANVHDEARLSGILAAILREVDPLTVIDGLELADARAADADAGAVPTAAMGAAA